MPAYNKQIIVGNCGSDAEMRFTGNGDPVTSFNVAVNKQGPKREETLWYRVSVFGKQAQFFADNIHGGTLVMVEGRFYPRMYEKDGVQRLSLELTSNEIQILSSRSASESATSVDEEEDVRFA